MNFYENVFYETKLNLWKKNSMCKYYLTHSWTLWPITNIWTDYTKHIYCFVMNYIHTYIYILKLVLLINLIHVQYFITKYSSTLFRLLWDNSSHTDMCNWFRCSRQLGIKTHLYQLNWQEFFFLIGKFLLKWHFSFMMEISEKW